ncbi:MAG TPA: DUF6062 family protein [Chthonomonadaceae bacterium]|nr:DUF6062 family protein [Chthonomonadaceae bacterium]
MSAKSSEQERSSEATLHEILTALLPLGPADIGPRVSAPSPDSLSASSRTESTCAVCRLVARSIAQSVRAFFAEFVNDPRAREELRRARGFCGEHAALLATLGDALGVAILYSDLARLTQERWESGTAGETGGRKGLRWGWPRHAPVPSAPCPACADAQEAERRYTGALAAGLGEARVWEALEAGSGLCVAHAEQVMRQAAPAHAARLRQLEAARLAALQAELDEIIRKNDYRFRGEPWGPEKDAWLRALKKITRP